MEVFEDTTFSSCCVSGKAQLF